MIKAILRENKATLEMKGKREIKEEDKIMKNRKKRKKREMKSGLERMLEKDGERVKCGEEVAG